MSNYYGLIETVKQCAYPSKMLDYFANTIIELVNNSPSAKVYSSTFRGDTIATIRYNIQTPFKEKVFEVPVIIYLTKNMPYDAPEVYLDKGQDTGVNPKSIEIDQRTNRIMTPSLLNWNSQMTLFNVTKEITESFKKNFPIYKITKSIDTTSSNANMGYNYGQGNFMGGSSVYQPNTGLNNSNYYANTGYMNNSSYYQPHPNTFVNPNPNPIPYSNNTNFNNMTTGSTSSISSTTPPTAYTNFYHNIIKQPPHKNTIYQSIYQQNANQFVGSTYTNPTENSSYYPGPNIGNPYSGSNNNYIPGTGYIQPSINNTKNVDSELSNVNLAFDSKKAEDEIKKVLINEIKQSVESKIKEESKRNKQTEEKLKNYKNEFSTQNEKYQKFIGKKEDIENGMKRLCEDIDREIQNVQMYLTKMQDKILNSSNFEKHINISNTALLNIIAIEATIEDFIGVIKKTYERNILTFNDTLRTIRALSREAIKIKFYREKLTKQINC